jgi:hypothetical protein
VRLGLLGVLAVCLSVSACLPSAARDVSPTIGGAASAAPPPPSTPTPVPAPSAPTPRPSFVPPTPTPVPTFLVYTVASGDSLNTIAHRFGTTARSIAFWNRATYPTLDPEAPGYKPGLLKVGWTLMVIPNAVFDEQDLPEPSDLVGPQPTPTPSDDGAAAGTDDPGGDIDPNTP